MESSPGAVFSQQPQLPPGFRFHPTDEELVVHYLKKKAASAPLPVTIIPEIDLYKFDPWELPGKATFGEQEWYFFSPRDRKYPNGARPNRAATSGYWKATGTDKPILTSGGTQKVGVKKALVFYGGRPPKGIKTNWIMHEYRLVESGARPAILPNKKGSLRLDDWVLCRIYKKHNNSQRPPEREQDESCVEEVLASLPEIDHQQKLHLPKLGSFSGLLENEDPFLDGFLNDASIDGNGNNSSLQAEPSNRYQTNMNKSTDCSFHTVPKQEISTMETENKFNSLKRTFSLAYRDEALNPPKRYNNENYSTNNNVSALINSMQPNQTFNQQQQQNLLDALNDCQQNFRMPYMQNINWSSSLD
ncbi:hypothetical protein SUGI_0712530 [Cryptomeria japonica]|nr:hypothetical protein SUGI_0712530 [Cryptomeria japonica]